MFSSGSETEDTASETESMNERSVSSHVSRSLGKEVDKGISVRDVLEGTVKLQTDCQCEELECENDDGNMEYKLKLLNKSPERLNHLVCPSLID